MTENPWSQNGGSGTPAATPQNSAPLDSASPPMADGGTYGTPPDGGAAPGPATPAAGTTTMSAPAPSTADTAKHEAGEVAHRAAESAQSVAETAKAGAADVAAEAKTNARDLFQQATKDLTDQAGAQQQKVAEGLHSISKELHSMASASEQPGVATDLVRQAAERSSAIAGWLDGRDPGSLLTEVKSFARERPGTFLMLAAGAGILAGRLSRSLSAGAPGPAAGDMAAPGTSEGPNARVPDGRAAVPPPPVQSPGPAATTAGVSDTYPPNPSAADATESDEWPADPPIAKPVADPPSTASLAGPRSTGSPHDDPFGGGPR